jgi:hypothetical protein
MEFQPKVNFDLFFNMFRLTFIHLTHLSTIGSLGMVFEHLQYLFDPKDSIIDFPNYSWCVFMLLEGISLIV